ncbi:MAG: FeoB-associated Cys-rich membrane protein [Acidobacteria bacterium]|nr:FeoB-associated Cys-rich membrane protein [Acidobacteriota bacterium]
MDGLIVAFVVGTAVTYLARRFYKTAHAKTNCGTCSSTCSSKGWSV